MIQHRLNALRALAIMLVLVVHGGYMSPGGSLFKLAVRSMIQGCALGVSIFFCLSGYLITRACLNEKYGWWRSYIRKRIAKIIPPFYLSLILALCFMSGYSWNELTAQMLKLALFVTPFLSVPVAWNRGVYWTLPYEVYFYIAAPLLLLLLTKKRKWYFPAFLALTSIVSMLYACAYGASIASAFLSQYIFFAWGSAVACLPANRFQSLPPRFLDLFLIGALFFLMWIWGLCIMVEMKEAMMGQPLRMCYDIVFGGVVAALMLPWQENPTQNFLDRIITSRILGFIALISYEIYLFHPIALNFVRELPISQELKDKPLGLLIWSVFPLILSMLWATVIYFYYSLPLHEWIVGERTAVSMVKP